MKIKWFLRGLGVGIVVTALLLCITYRNTKENTNIIQQAKELGMVFPKNETESAEETANRLAQEVKKQENVEQTVTQSAVVAEDKELTEKEKKAKEKLESSEKDIKNASAFQNGKKTFVVRSGLLSSSVSREMEEAGIIEDSKAFDEYLEKKGYGRMVRSGKYKIPEGADFETIAKIITRQD